MGDEQPMASKAGPALHYDLVMSADDNVCKPLVTLYNKLLAHAMSVVMANPRHDNLISLSQFSDFEVQRPGDFEAMGFKPPAFESGNATSGIFHADIFNDGEQRLLFSIDELIHGDYYTSLRLIKRDGDKARLQTFGELVSGRYVPGVSIAFGGWRRFSDIFENVDIGLSSATSDIGRRYGIYATYVLSKWPHLDRAMVFWRSHPLTLGPFIGGHTLIRVFTYKNLTILVSDEYAMDIGDVNSESVVVVYRASRIGATDLCYLKMKSGK